MAARFDGLPSFGYHETPSPHAMRPSQLPPVPESVRRTRECVTQTRLSVERVLESARRLKAESLREEPCPTTQRSPVFDPDAATERTPEVVS